MRHLFFISCLVFSRVGFSLIGFSLIGFSLGCTGLIALVGCSQRQPDPQNLSQSKESTLNEPAAGKPPGSATPSVDTLRSSLAAATDSKARVLVIDEIAKLGRGGRVALDELLKATTDADPRPRWHAARAIGLIGEDAISAMPTLLLLLEDSDPIVATQAASAIAQMRADDDRDDATPPADAAAYQSATTALVRTMLHADPRVRRASLRALSALHPSPELLVPLINRQLADADPSVVLPAIHSLADMGDEAVPFLMESLKNPKARYWASVALAEIGPDASPATDLLTEILARGDAATEERMQAILALAAIGPAASSAADELVRTLGSPEGSLRFASAFALGRMRAQTADAALDRAAADPDPFLSEIAAWARARIHPHNKPLVEAAVQLLQDGLSSPQPNVRSGSVSALSDLCENLDDSQDTRLSQRFVGLLNDSDPDVRANTAAALVRLGPLAVDALEAALDDPERRVNAMELLAGLGPTAKPALDSLVKGLADSDPVYCSDAAMALAAIGSSAAEAVPQLHAMLLKATRASNDDTLGLAYSAAYALGSIGTAAKPAVADLISLSASKDEMLATVAVWATLKIQPEDASLFTTAVPLLRKALRGDREIVRLEAAVALGDIGTAAETAVPILELVAEDDPVQSVRSAAKQALAKIRGG